MLTEEKKKELIMGVIKSLFINTQNKTAEELIAFMLNVNINEIIKSLDKALVTERDKWLQKAEEYKSIAKEIDDYRMILRRN